ncbi:hypothetical protein KUTeg_022821 [Tegillarca granosa]|uniref:Uncharacterized protein n=1 Tax=Tegillarca granosa TaxID=220873 RepID=A0ABQ9DZW1_TEGGR|nr:hypothetical protein KUTeg_022821 [Tegillarca granosa]
MEKSGIRKDKDVEQLYLADSELTEVTDLSRFRLLKILWLNGNKLRRINCLKNNFNLAELHLHDNQLVEISGALQHLTCLKVLMLQNNQLTKLEKVVKEFLKMQTLHTLIPSVQLLDRQEVTKNEKDEARTIYDQDQEKIRDTVAFGRRSEGPPSIYYASRSGRSSYKRDIGNSFIRDNPLYETKEDAINARRLKKSVTVFTTFDWSKLPNKEQRRQSDKPFDSPELITHDQ